MKQALIVGVLALLSTLSFATEKLGTQNFEPETLGKIKSFKTISPMSLNKVNNIDAAFLSAIAYGAGDEKMAQGGFAAISDLFWATKCSNEYVNTVAWFKDYSNSKANNNKSIILARLGAQASSNNADAKLAYRAIIIAERVANCGSESDVYGNFIELVK